MKLETQRLLLRNYKDTDLEDYWEFVSQANVGPRCGWGVYTDKQKAAERLKYEISKPLQFAIVLKEKNKVISIEDLIKYNNQILNIFSKISREKLKNNKRIVSASMFFEGTRPKKENFINFAFTKDGILLFYPYYQIAPYSEGEFNVIIPYDNINKLYNK